jgi:hypothetical protein
MTITKETIERNGFKQDFGTWVRACEVCVVIVGKRRDLKPAIYGVYITHGHPGGEFWRNSAPLVSGLTLEEARQKAETIYGIAGSGELATLVMTDR